MEFRVLGQLEVWRSGTRVPLGPFKQRCLLALLLLHANQAVSTDRIIDELWSDEAVVDRHNALWVQVSKLRSRLEPSRERHTDGQVVVTREQGYAVRVGPDELDAARFERLLEQGRNLVDADPASASLALGEALALWRGRPYEDFLYESFAQIEIARLDELRLQAVELRIDADLRRGLAPALIGELQGLVRQHPLREQLTAYLMLALHRSGRQAEALRAYANLRSNLGEELGLEPSRPVQQLEGQILQDDPALEAHPGALGSSDRLSIRGYELREQIASSGLGMTYRAYQPAVGREVAVTVVAPRLANDGAFVRNFEPEAGKAARLEHPRLLPLWDFWREPEGAFVVTPLVRGRTLNAVLHDGPLAIAPAVTAAGDVAAALTAAHRRGVVHGGLEPALVVVGEDGHGSLSGFGIASASRQQRSTSDRFAAPEQVSSGVATPATDIYALGRVLADALSGGGPSADNGPTVILPAALAAVVDRACAADPAARFPDVSSFAAALQATVDAEIAVGPVADGPVLNPYKGLHAFGELDAAEFFGRERVVERLVARLGGTGTFGRFVAVVGPSGSGKSSVVGAGLLPVVRHGAVPGSAEWYIAQLTPNRDPYEELTGALVRVAVDPPADLLEQLTDGSDGLGRAVRGLLPDGRSQLLLVVDQFEELFTLAQPSTCRSFLDSLAAAVADQHSRVRVVITLRADFYDRPLQHHAFGDLLRRGTELVVAMPPEELQRAAEQPAALRGVRFEPELVEEIVTDVADHATALPLLQYALTELFEHRRGRVIDRASYEELGGAAGALARRAEAVFLSFDEEARETTRQVMLRLANVGDGDTDDVTRGRVFRQDLLVLGTQQVATVLDSLGEHRLLGFDRDAVTRAPTVEIAHEALFTQWDRLRDWITDCRDDVRQHRRLATATEEWVRQAEASDYLVRGARLDELIAFADAGTVALAPTERSFLDASVAQREHERASQRAQADREARLRRKGHRRNLLLVGGAVALALVTLIAVSAVLQRRRSNHVAALRNEAAGLATASTKAVAKDPDLAMLLALQSLATSARAGEPARSGAQDALEWGLQAAGVTFPGGQQQVEVHQSPSGPAGVFGLALTTVVELARKHLTRGFTSTECAEYHLRPCPSAGSGLASPATAGPTDLPASLPFDRPAVNDRSLAGTSITVLDPLGDQPLAQGPTDAEQAEIQRFSATTGIAVHVIRPGAPLAITGLPGGERPDVVLWPYPGTLDELARDGRLVDLTTYLDRSALRQELGDYMVDAATTGSGVYWIPMDFVRKAVVWYPVRQFQQAGYEVPRTWDELIALSQRMVADNRTPWCFGLEGGQPYTGQDATDWVEALAMRVGGADTYDRWTTHQVPFASPAVRQAGQMFGQIAFGDHFVLGGLVGTKPHTGRVSFPLFDEPPGCWMFLGTDLEASLLPPRARLGEDVDYFALPPLVAGTTPTTIGSVYAAAAMTDRPEVRAFMSYLAGPRWGHVGASLHQGAVFPARVNLAVTDCIDRSGTTEADAVRIRLCQEARDALATGQWRLDASDLMPGKAGVMDADGNSGAFATGMVTYLNEGAASLDRVLSEIDAAWPANG